MMRTTIRASVTAYGVPFCARVFPSSWTTTLSDPLGIPSSSRAGAGISSVGLLSPTRPLLRGFTEDRQTVEALRQKLKRQTAERASVFDTFDTESRLALALAQSRVLNERLEGLQRGEDIWNRLEGKSTSGPGGQSNYIQLPSSSLTTMRMTISTGMRRCALQCGRRDVAETWTRRFAEKRRNISFDDFDTPYGSQDENGDPAAAAPTAPVAGSQQLNARRKRDAMSGSGNQFYMGEEYDDGDEDDDGKETQASGASRLQSTAEGSESSEEAAKKKKKPAKKLERPVDRMRHEMMLEHPMIDVIHKRRPTPGPRYTGSC